MDISGHLPPPTLTTFPIYQKCLYTNFTMPRIRFLLPIYNNSTQLSPPPFRGRVLRLIYIFSLFVHNALSRCKCIFVLLRYMRRVSHCIISFITSMHFFTARSFLSLDLPRFAYFISALFGCDYPKEFLRFLM